MIFKLLRKELLLAAHPNLLVFTALGALIIVPSYPYGIIPLFSCLGVYISFTYGRETNDIYYTALLPLRKKDVVTSKFVVVITLQLVQLLITIPFVFLRQLLHVQLNQVGLQANLTFFTYSFICYALFNLIFLSQFFSNIYKIGREFLLTLIPLTLWLLIAEIGIHFPPFRFLAKTSAAAQWPQLPGLLISIAVYLLLSWLSYRRATRNFQQVNL